MAKNHFIYLLNRIQPGVATVLLAACEMRLGHCLAEHAFWIAPANAAAKGQFAGHLVF
jgi:hypothetical protein